MQNLKTIVEEIKNQVKKHGLPEGITLSEAEIETKINEAIIINPYAFTHNLTKRLEVIKKHLELDDLLEALQNLSAEQLEDINRQDQEDDDQNNPDDLCLSSLQQLPKK